ncbi:MAG TPA: PglZ domain-containing protein, partial [Armatimonadetes bacterium]|nr:PglZ domain-containing protein [Armatimonadota bacterium]
TQTGFWKEFRRKRGRKVVFFVDALRFDLAQHLKEKLRDHVSFEVKPLQVMLPSITELGMSALLPDAEKGLKVELQEGALCVCIDDRVVSTREGRRQRLKEGLGKGGMVVTLEELEQTDLSDIRTLVVISREVDEFGTFAGDLHPQGLFELTERIADAVRFIAENGFDHIWVVADHGFLFIPSSMKLETLSAPKAGTCKRRFALGASAEGCIVKEAHQLGLDGDVTFAFPKGVDVFALPGELGAFLHGGLSLQECIVASMYGKVAAPIRKVKVKMTIQEPITSRTVLVTVSAESVTLFDQPRWVKVKIGERESEPVEVSPNSPQAQMSLSWLEFDEEPPHEVKISLQDADTGEVLDERLVNVE